MDFKDLKWHMVHGPLARRLILRAFLFVLAMFILSFTRIANEIRTIEPILLNFDKCSLNIGSTNPPLNIPGLSQDKASLFPPCVDSKNLTISVIRELMNKEMLNLDSKALCVGEGSDSTVLTLRELGFSNAFGVNRYPFISLLQKRFEHELDFKDNSFDFVFSRTLDSVSVPAYLVLEVERVLRPGGTGAMLIASSTFYMGSLVRSATPVSLLLRSSEILHVCGIGSFTVIVFKKRLNNVAFFKDYRLPNECRSISENKPFMQSIEPLVDQKLGETRKELSYLPKFINVSSRNRLVYVNMGAGELEPDYPIHPQAFNVYVVDHDVSALSSYVKKPGVTFVYHPGLVEGKKVAPSLTPDDYVEAPLHEEQFEFVDWFKETAKDGDYVVLMMNAGLTQLKVLFELFESGAICHVDELFLRCSNGVDCRTGHCRDCMSLFMGLRNAGVFVHQWLGD